MLESDFFKELIYGSYSCSSYFRGEDLVVELPGFKKADVELTLESGALSLRAKTGGKTAFIRSWALRPEVDAGAITAGLEDGLLTIKLPLREGSRKRLVAIT